MKYPIPRALLLAAITAACGSSTWAQQVQVGGQVRLSVNSVRAGNASSVTSLTDNASRLSFRGSEDLGGGLGGPGDEKQCAAGSTESSKQGKSPEWGHPEDARERPADRTFCDGDARELIARSLLFFGRPDSGRTLLQCRAAPGKGR